MILRVASAGVFVVRGNRTCAAEDGGAVDGGDFVHVGTIEDVEGVNHQIQPKFLPDLEVTGDAEIPGIETVAVVGVARNVADAVGNGIGVAVGVEADEGGEGTRGLQVMMLLNAKLRMKESLGPSAVKLVMKRWRMSWLELARSSGRSYKSCGVLTKVVKVPSSSVCERV